MAQSKVALVLEREGWKRLCYINILRVTQIFWYVIVFKYSLLILQTWQSLVALLGRRGEERQLLINFTSGTGPPIEIKNSAWKKAQNVPHLTNKLILRLEFKQQMGFTFLQLYNRSHKNVTSLVMCIKTLTASERKQLAEW